MTVRAIKPIEITSAMVVASTLFETAPATYAAGTTYALGAYASVAGLLGEILIYKSLQAGNIGNTPASSPTWWFLSSKTYEVFIRSSASLNQLGYRVIDTVTHSVYESTTTYSSKQPLDSVATPVWVSVDVPTPTVPAAWNSGTTYAAGALVYAQELGVVTGVPYVIDCGVYTSVAGGNIGNDPILTGAWNPVITYPTLHLSEASYAVGQIVKDASGKAYKCLIWNNNNCPLDNRPLWAKVNPTNATAFLDSEVSTQSVANGDMEFTIATGVIDTLALVGIQGGTATVTVRDGLGGTIAFQQTQGISGEIVADWWAFLYGDAAIPLRKVVFTELPPYVNAHVTIKIEGDGEVKLGAVVAGVQADIGIGASYGANIEVKDYSIKTTDDFGKTKFVKRGYKEVLEISVLLDKTSFNRTHNALINLRSTPWFLIVSDDPDLSEALYMYGFYNSYRNVIDYPTATIYSLQFESLVS